MWPGILNPQSKSGFPRESCCMCRSLDVAWVRGRHTDKMRIKGRHQDYVLLSLTKGNKLQDFLCDLRHPESGL